MLSRRGRDHAGAFDNFSRNGPPVLPHLLVLILEFMKEVIPLNFTMQALIQRCDTEREEMNLIEDHRPANPNSGLNQESDSMREPHPWLRKHDEEKRESTMRLVKATANQLLNELQTVTIEAMCHTSVELDPDRRRVKLPARYRSATRFQLCPSSSFIRPYVNADAPPLRGYHSGFPG